MSGENVDIRRFCGRRSRIQKKSGCTSSNAARYPRYGPFPLCSDPNVPNNTLKSAQLPLESEAAPNGRPTATSTHSVNPEAFSNSHHKNFPPIAVRSATNQKNHFPNLAQIPPH
jgi:hypothetical protein